MQIGALFYTDTLAMTHTTGAVMGRAVANHGLLRALAASEHALTIFVSSALEREPLAEWLGAAASHVRICSLVELARAPQSLDVLHLFGPDLYRGLHLRNTGAIGSPIITGMTHSLCHAPFLDWLALSGLHSPQPGDAIVCTTPTAAQTVHTMIAECAPQLPALTTLQTPVIPLGLDDEWQITRQPQLRAQWQIPADALLCLHFGRISTLNKVDLLPLLDAWHMLRAHNPRPVLLLTGAVTDVAELHALESAIAARNLQSAVRVLPNPDDAAKRALYAAADVAIALADNLQETFGISVIEALAAGLPVIAANWDGYRALVDDQVGWLLPTYMAADPAVQMMGPLMVDSMRIGACAQTTAIDLTALPTIIADCTHHPDALHARRIAARERGEQYRWNNILAQYSALWQQLRTHRAAANPQPAPLGPTLRAAPMFAHYPSNTIDRTALCTITAQGERTALPNIAPMLEELIPPASAQQIVQLLTTGPRTVAAIARELRSTHPEAQVISVLHWLMKQGMVVLQV